MIVVAGGGTVTVATDVETGRDLEASGVGVLENSGTISIGDSGTLCTWNPAANSIVNYGDILITSTGFLDDGGGIVNDFAGSTTRAGFASNANGPRRTAGWSPGHGDR